MRSVPASTVASLLGVSSATVINMINDGRLGGGRGPQPKRARWLVNVDDAGRPLAPDGSPVEIARTDASLADVVRRLATLERQVGAAAPAPPQGAREAAILLAATVDRQQKALALHAEAFELLNQTVSEQAQVIATLLMPDSPEAAKLS
jgi:hypothetical protein